MLEGIISSFVFVYTCNDQYLIYSVPIFCCFLVSFIFDMGLLFDLRCLWISCGAGRGRGRGIRGRGRGFRSNGPPVQAAA